MRANNIEIAICKNCFHSFPRAKTALKSRSRYGLPIGVRPAHCLTCSKLCSKEYQRSRPSYAQRLKLKLLQ